MKIKIILILFIVLAGFSGTLLAQKTQKLNNGVNVNVSKPMQLASYASINDFAKANGIESFNSPEELKNRMIYTVDGMILIYKKTYKNERIDLIKLKESHDKIAESVDAKKNTSILEDHGYKMLISESNAGNMYQFLIVNDSLRLNIAGKLQFNPAKKPQAKIIMDEIIKTITFE
ncbi:MAG: hypothetical protein ACQUHE_10815 [Bacteroidia bacterium]